MLDYYGSVQLTSDVIHVNDVPFLTSISNHRNYETSNAVGNVKAHVLEVVLMSVIKSYAFRGFSVGVTFLDTQFKRVKYRNNLGITVSIVIK